MDTETRPLLTPAYDEFGCCTRCGHDEPCRCGRLPYIELFVNDESAESSELTWRWICNVCGIDVGLIDRKHCPLHVPGEVPGLVMAECWAEPKHSRVWYPDQENGYGNPCPFCMYEPTAQAHELCAHAAHGRWRRWKATHRVLRALSLAGLVRGLVYSFGRGCQDCVTFRWRWSK